MATVMVAIDFLMKNKEEKKMGEEKRCPNCRTTYLTELARKDDRNIQEQYPNEPAWKREQLISGLCSNKCWEEFLGIPQGWRE